MAITIILCAIISGIFYRCGGMSKDKTAQPTWIPMFLRNSWCRDWLCPLFALIALCTFEFSWSYWWLYLIFYGLSGASLSTYWDWAFKGVDNYYCHGFVCGLVGFVLIFAGIPWWVLIIRLVFCTLMGLWSKKIDTDYIEEMGRGFLFVI